MTNLQNDLGMLGAVTRGEKREVLTKFDMYRLLLNLFEEISINDQKVNCWGIIPGYGAEIFFSIAHACVPKD